MVTQTTNYQFNIPAPTDTMADPVNQINNTWQKIDNAANPDIITAVGGVYTLPITGYKPGDRVYVEDPGFDLVNSSFICLTEDVLPWGNWWMPVQAARTPWRTVPPAAYDPNFIQLGGDPWQLMVNNRGKLFSRGSVRTAGASLPNDTTQNLTRVPVGLNPASGGFFIGAIDPTNFNASGGTYDQFRAARQDLSQAGDIFIRCHGATAAPATVRVFMNQMRWPIGRNDYTIA